MPFRVFFIVKSAFRKKKLDNVSPSLGLLHTDMSDLSGGRQFGGRLRTGISRLNSSAAGHPPLLYSWPPAIRFQTTPEREGPGLQEQLAVATISHRRDCFWKAPPGTATTLPSMYQDAYEGTRQINFVDVCIVAVQMARGLLVDPGPTSRPRTSIEP